MKVLGITAEYDPFHNGHRYHLEAAKATVAPDVTLCVMSGDITQRGELAVLDKWTRARIAVDQGLDLVLELPFMRACSPAPGFAAGAVDMLVLAGATHIAFGCEAEDPDKLTELARLQIAEADKIEELTRIEMKSGLSHVKARQNASSRIIGEELTRLSLAPNNILALEYLKRMAYWQENGNAVEAVPILRKGSGYREANADMAGGSAIRVMLEAGWDVSRFIPYDIGEYAGDVESGCGSWIDMKAAGEEMLKQLKGIVLRSSREELMKIRFVGEGIENKLIREITDAESFKDLLDRMTSKRYTTSTIRRMLICILMGVTKEMAGERSPQVGVSDGPSDGMSSHRQEESSDGPTDSPPDVTADTPSDVSPDVSSDALIDASLYGRILAATEGGRGLISTEPGLPFIANINKRAGLSEAAERSLEMDVRAADLYNLITGQDVYGLSDHRQRPYIE